jgi:uncharacterized protein YjbJ (UPF0337 family)
MRSNRAAVRNDQPAPHRDALRCGRGTNFPSANYSGNDGSIADAAHRQEAHMDWNQLEGNWKQFKGKIKEHWGNLTDDDLMKLEGNRDQFEGALQERYGMTKEQIHKEVDEWLKTLH